MNVCFGEWRRLNWELGEALNDEMVKLKPRPNTVESCSILGWNWTFSLRILFSTANLNAMSSVSFCILIAVNNYLIRKLFVGHLGSIRMTLPHQIRCAWLTQCVHITIFQQSVANAAKLKKSLREDFPGDWRIRNTQEVLPNLQYGEVPVIIWGPKLPLNQYLRLVNCNVDKIQYLR